MLLPWDGPPTRHELLPLHAVASGPGRCGSAAPGKVHAALGLSTCLAVWRHLQVHRQGWLSRTGAGCAACTHRTWQVQDHALPT